ncbi:MAG: hypothetical protein HC875_26225 [Anaerolineales bacterium]|nr:hypothetical protein [Anaerolineales bacterium]
MTPILQATYQDGRLVLDQPLQDVVEGQTLRVMILDSDHPALKKERFLNAVARYNFDLPADYYFNRDEFHAR